MTAELDQVLTVVGNSIRRRIIRRLSQEPSYPLELAGDLGIHQQLVAKHLRVMEEAELVGAKTESSPYGPDRRMYNLIKSVSLTIDFSPDLYNTRMFSLEDASLSLKHEAAGEFAERLDHLSTKDVGLQGINAFAELIADIDKRVAELEGERAVLLYLRSLAMRAAKDGIQGKGVPLRERMALYHILNGSERTAREISGSLDM